MKTLSVLFISALIMVFTASTGFAFGTAGTAPAPAAPTAQAEDSISGKVVETMDSGGYTYVSVEKAGNKTWVAVPAMKVTVGQEISLSPGMPMNNFTSKSLNRTFETIIFSSGPVGQSASMPSLSPSSTEPAKEIPKNIKVEKASGPNAYTVAELYEKSSALDKKSITLKGQVVKVSAAIMNKNWIHIQDGSGSASSGNDDIIVTSQDMPAVGDVVTVNGIVYKDKDFGSGYKYSVIVEEGSIKK